MTAHQEVSRRQVRSGWALYVLLALTMVGVYVVVVGVLDLTVRREVSLGSSVLTPEAFGAVGDGVADDTAAVQRALDAMRSDSTLLFSSGKIYRHSDVLIVRVPGVHLTGPGVLLASNEARSSFWIAANDVLVDGGLTFRMGTTTKRWDAYEQMGIRLAGVSGTTLRAVKVEGSPAAGIYIGRSCCKPPATASSDFLLEDVSVSNTRADGIHITGGSHNGIVRRAVTTNTGDDGIAIVSYVKDGALTKHITVETPVVLASHARGLAVVGGEDITYRDVTVDRASAAAIYIASEGNPYNTFSVKRISCRGGTLTRSNTNRTVDHGAVLLYSGRPGFTVRDVLVEGLSISNTRMGASWQVGVLSDGGAVAGVRLVDFTIRGGGNVFATNASEASYSKVGLSVDGTPRPDHLP